MLLTPVPVDGDVVARAAGVVWGAHKNADALELRVVDGAAVLQVLEADEVTLSVLRPRMIPTPDEVSRLLPATQTPEGTEWWGEAYTPWGTTGITGLAILDAIAQESGGIAVHHG